LLLCIYENTTVLRMFCFVSLYIYSPFVMKITQRITIYKLTWFSIGSKMSIFISKRGIYIDTVVRLFKTNAGFVWGFTKAYLNFHVVQVTRIWL